MRTRCSRSSAPRPRHCPFAGLLLAIRRRLAPSSMSASAIRAPRFSRTWAGSCALRAGRDHTVVHSGRLYTPICARSRDEYMRPWLVVGPWSCVVSRECVVRETRFTHPRGGATTLARARI
eukprot:scaffold15696_cov113-Isochrysis_galbana.AAC.7